MAIMIPGWLQWLEWVAGTDWPEGNEDLQQQLGQDIEAVVDQIRDTVVPAVERAVDAVLVAYPDGDGKEQIKQELDKLVPQLEQLASTYADMGNTATEHATQIRSNKLNGIIALAWLAAELAYAAFLGPYAPLAQTSALATTRVVFQWLGRRLFDLIGRAVAKMAISHTAKAIATKVVYEIMQEAIVEVLQGTSQELGVQGLNVAHGFQDHMKWGEVGINAGISAIAGGVGGGAGHGMHNLMGRTSLSNAGWGGMGKGAVVGAGAGLAGAGAAYVSTGGFTGEWELDPRMLTGGALSGMGPSMVYGWRGAYDYAGSPMPTTRPTAPVGSMPGANSGAGDGSTAAGGGNGSGAVSADGVGTGNTAAAAPGGQGAGAAPDAAAASANSSAAASGNGAATTADGAADTAGQGAGDGSISAAGDGPASVAGDGSTNSTGENSTPRDGSDPSAANGPAVDSGNGISGNSDSVAGTEGTHSSATNGASTPTSESAAEASAERTPASDPAIGRAEQPEVAADTSVGPAGVSENHFGTLHSEEPVGGAVSGAARTQPPVTSPPPVGPAPTATPTGATSSSTAGTSNASPQSGEAASSPAQHSDSPAAQSSTSPPRDRRQAQEGLADPVSDPKSESGTATSGSIRASADTAGAGVVDGSMPRVSDDVVQAGPTDSTSQQHVSDSTAAESSTSDSQPPIRDSATSSDKRVVGGTDTSAPATTTESASGAQGAADQDAAVTEVLPAHADPPTTSEVGHAKDALRQLGDDADATDLLNADHREPDVAENARAKARTNARWWGSLTEAQQRAMVRVHPEEIGNAPGLDPATVDTANRLRIARELDALSSRSDLDAAENKQLDNLRATVDALADAQRRAAAIDPDLPVRVLGYDAIEFGGQGRAAVAFGDVTTANHVSWHVPGRGHALSNLDADIDIALDQYRAAQGRTRVGETIASVAWLGYRVPTAGQGGFTLSRARAGAERLLKDMASLDAVRATDSDTGPTNKVVAQGYGVDVAEAAGKHGRLTGVVGDVALTTPHTDFVRPDRFDGDVRVFAGVTHDGLYTRVDAAYVDQLGASQADRRLFGLNVISADGAGATAYRPPDTGPVTGADEDVFSAARRNNCAPISLASTADHTGNTDIAVPEADSVGPQGMHWRALQRAAGGELTPVAAPQRSAHQTIAEVLRTGGGRSTVLVVDEQRGRADEYGVGAHSYVMYFDPETSTVMVDDARIGTPFEFDQDNPPDMQTTWGIFYDAEGSPMHPLGGDSAGRDAPGQSNTRAGAESHGSSARGRHPDPVTMDDHAESDSAARPWWRKTPARPSRIGESSEPPDYLVGPRGAGSRLVADVGITTADRRLVAGALQALADVSGGPATLSSLVPVLDTSIVSTTPTENSAEVNAQWWHELSVSEQRAVVVVHPAAIGRTDGIPAAVRDEANRLSLRREINSYLELFGTRYGDSATLLRGMLSRSTLDGEQRKHLRCLLDIQRSLTHAEKLAAAMHPEVATPDVRLLSYDGVRKRGRAAVAFGDVDTAASVSWHVFGVRADVHSLPEKLELVRNAYETTVRADRNVTTAAVAWLDYDAPSTYQQTSDSAAKTGGARLASVVAGLHATRAHLAEHRHGAPVSDHHLFGHRFGATVLSEAAAGARLAGKATSLVFLGSSGTGSVRSAAEYGPNVRVYAGRSSQDRADARMANFPGLRGGLLDVGPGGDPTVEQFGAIRIAAEFPVEGAAGIKKSPLSQTTLNAMGYPQAQYAEGIPVNDQYYWFTDEHTRAPTEALANIGRIASGHGHEVVLAPHRTVPDSSNFWQRAGGSRVVDPESERRVTFYDGTVDRNAVTLPETADAAILVADALALRGPGVRAADLMHRGHADDMTRARDVATDNAHWWDSLGGHEADRDGLSPMQRALIDAHPFEVGNADGIPSRVRDIANRLQLDRDLRELRKRRPGSTLFLPRGASSITALERAQMRNLLSTREALGRSATVRPGIEQPPVHLLSFDSLAFGGEGRAVVAIGDVDTAEHVAWQVPGITTMVEKLSKRLQMARDPYEAMAQASPNAKIASIAWIGYDAPSGNKIWLESRTPAFAEVGGRILARDVMAYHAARVARTTDAEGAPPQIHLFGHSYGSTTTAYGAAGGRLSREVATITLVGSPGAGPVQHASEFGIGAENVFVAKLSYDPVTALGALEPGRDGRFFNMGLGQNPAVEAFGAVRVPSQFPAVGLFKRPFPAHGAYFDYIDRDTGELPESLQSFGLIATGRGSEVGIVGHRVVPEAPRVWHRTFGWAPKDPEGQRSPGDGTRPYRSEGTPTVSESRPDEPKARGARPEIQGHRGARGLWSENTLAGYRQAFDLGVDVIELDVGLTSDQVPVISHEQRIDGATARDTGPVRLGDPQYPYVGKPIRKLGFDQVRTLSTAVVNRKFADTQHAAPPGSRVPSLVEVAELADGRGVTLAVELKTDPTWSDADIRAIVEATVDTLSGYDVQYRILGFDWRVLDWAVQLAPPDVERVALISPRTTTRDWLGHDPGETRLGRVRGMAAAQLGGPGRTPAGALAALARQAGATMLSPNRAMVTDDFVQQAADSDLPLVPYTVNDPNRMRELIDKGVAGVVTDFPDLLRAVLTEQGFEVPESARPRPVVASDDVPDSGRARPAEQTASHSPEMVTGPTVSEPEARVPADPDDVDNHGEVLPHDDTITERERELAEQALERRAPHAVAERLLHGNYSDTETVASARDRASSNARWWDGLAAAGATNTAGPTPRMSELQAAVCRVHPEIIGNTDGVPAVVRDYANRLAIGRALRELGGNARGRAEVRLAHNLESTVTALVEAQRMAEQVAQRTGATAPPVHVLSYDATAFGGKGRAVVAFGDVDVAESVSWRVPGVKTNMQKLAWNLDSAANLYAETATKTTGTEIASVAWLGYDTPTGRIAGLRSGRAEAGATLLARDIAAFNAARAARTIGETGRAWVHNHVFGHSYGSTTTAYAGSGARLAGEVATITLSGSPGAGPVTHAAEFGAAVQVFVAAASSDSVTSFGANRQSRWLSFLGLGIDPSIETFQATRLAAEFHGPFRDGRRHHTQYYGHIDTEGNQSTEALANFGRIGAGLGDTVTVEEHRPGVGDPNRLRRALLGAKKRDPAATAGIDDGTHGYRRSNEPTQAPNGPEVQGHRGGRGRWAENTLPGFAQAMRLGVDAIELDVGLTADGHPVVHHEQRIDGKTARDTAAVTPDDPSYPYVGTAIRELTLAQIRTLDTGIVHPKFAETQYAEPETSIPMLDEVAALVSETGWDGTLAVEIKTDPNWLDGDVESLVAATVSRLESHGVAYRILGFDWRVLSHAAVHAPGAERVALVSARTADVSWLGRDAGVSVTARARMLWAQLTGRARDPGGDIAAAAAATGATTLSAERSMVTESLMTQAREAGLTATAWTVNDPAEMHRLIELGVDGIVSDFPDRVREVMTHRGRAVRDAFDLVIPVNDCAPRSLRTVVELTGSDTVRVPDSASVGLSGMSDAGLEAAAGGRLEIFGSGDRVAQRLTAMGPGAAVVVVEQYSGPADRHGVGAHAYVMSNEDGAITVRDPGLGFPHTYRSGEASPDVTDVFGILFAADGVPVRPTAEYAANPDAYTGTGIGTSEQQGNQAERGEPTTLIVGEENPGPREEHQRLEAGSHTWRWITEQLSGWPADRIDDIGLEVADLVAVKLAGADSVRVELDQAGELGARDVRITVADTVMEFVEFPPVPAGVVEAIAHVRHLALLTRDGPAVAVGFRRFHQIARALASLSDSGGPLDVVQDRIDHGLRHRSNLNRSRLHAMQHDVEAEYVSLRSEGDRVDLTIYPFRDQDLRDGMRRLGLTGREDAPIALDVLVDAITDVLSERRIARVAETTAEASGAVGIPEDLPTAQSDQEVRAVASENDRGASVPDSEHSTTEPNFWLSETERASTRGVDSDGQSRPTTLIGHPAEEPLWQLSAAEQQLQSWGIGRETQLHTETFNTVYRVDFGEGRIGVYKPEPASVDYFEVPDSGVSVRAVAFSRLDELLRFGLVPVTTPYVGSDGHGALTEFVTDMSPWRRTSQYPQQQQDQMLVLDYIAGNNDRNRNNWFTLLAPESESSGRDSLTVVPLDNDNTFPVDRGSFTTFFEGEWQGGTASHFIEDGMHRQLQSSVLEQVRSLAPADLERMLASLGIEQAAIDGAVDRLAEIQRLGMVDGEAWPELGGIRDSAGLPPASEGAQASSRPWVRVQESVTARGEPLKPLETIGGLRHANAAFRLTFADGSSWVYKPASGEARTDVRVPPSGAAAREVGAYALDALLGFDVVAPTVWFDGGRGPGSLQQFVRSRPWGKPLADYSRAERDMLAVLDYVGANRDRSWTNYLEAEDGSLVAIDNGYMFPDGGDTTGIRSSFVADAMNQQLDPDVLARVRALDPGRLRAALFELGLEPDTVRPAVARLMEIQANGRITGVAWNGQVRDVQRPPSWLVAPSAPMSEGEQAFHYRGAVAGRPEPLGRYEHVNQVFRVGFDDGSIWVYKPVAGESVYGTDIPPSAMAPREVAVSRLDTMLGFGIVPETTLWHGDFGWGSLMRFRDVGEGLSVGKYKRTDRAMVAVLDYISGATDRHLRNYFTDRNTGRVVPIDHGMTFPVDRFSFTEDAEHFPAGHAEDRFRFRSVFVADALGRGLPGQVHRQVRELSPVQLEVMLTELELEPAAIDAAVRRLVEIQINGRITGEQWLDFAACDPGNGLLVAADSTSDIAATVEQRQLPRWRSWFNLSRYVAPQSVATPSQSNDCAPKSLRIVADETASATVRAPIGDLGPAGMSAAALEGYARGRLEPVNSRDAVAERLLSDADPSQVVLLVDEYSAPVAADAVGAHAYVMAVRDGNVMVQDPNDGTWRPYVWGEAGPDTVRMAGVFFDNSGEALRPSTIYGQDPDAQIRSRIGSSDDNRHRPAPSHGWSERAGPAPPGGSSDMRPAELDTGAPDAGRSTTEQDFWLSDAERDALGSILHRVNLNDLREVTRLDFADGTVGVTRVDMSPEEAEEYGVPDSGLIVREVAMAQLDQLFGANMVPPCRLWRRPDTAVSLTDFVPHDPGLSVRGYSRAQIHMAAVLDYVIGNVDRNAGNWGTLPADSNNDAPRLLLLDHTDVLPEGPDSFTYEDGEDPEQRLGRIRSPFVVYALNEPLDPVVLERVAGLSSNQLHDRLTALGIEPAAVDEAVRRLAEIKREERITGAAWAELGARENRQPHEIMVPYGDAKELADVRRLTRAVLVDWHTAAGPDVVLGALPTLIGIVQSSTGGTARVSVEMTGDVDERVARIELTGVRAGMAAHLELERARVAELLEYFPGGWGVDGHGQGRIWVELHEVAGSEGVSDAARTTAESRPGGSRPATLESTEAASAAPAAQVSDQRNVVESDSVDAATPTEPGFWLSETGREALGAIVDEEEIVGSDDLARMEFRDGSVRVARSEAPRIFFEEENIPASGVLVREAAMAELDRLVGAGLVPSTRLWRSPRGPVSLTDFVAHRPGLAVRDYSIPQVHMAAAMDYIIGNVDRNSGNWATLSVEPAGDGPYLLLIDHTNVLPEGSDSFTFVDDMAPDLRGGRRRSPFVLYALDQPLDPGVFDRIAALTPARLRDRLGVLGIEEAAIADAVGRLEEIQRAGRITGAAWPDLGARAGQTNLHHRPVLADAPEQLAFVRRSVEGRLLDWPAAAGADTVLRALPTLIEVVQNHAGGVADVAVHKSGWPGERIFHVEVGGFDAQAATRLEPEHGRIAELFDGFPGSWGVGEHGIWLELREAARVDTDDEANDAAGPDKPFSLLDEEGDGPVAVDEPGTRVSDNHAAGVVPFLGADRGDRGDTPREPSLSAESAEFDRTHYP